MTQNNGKQVILPGGHTHFLDHKNWKFEKFMTLKVQTDELETASRGRDDVREMWGGKPLRHRHRPAR